MSSRRSLFSRVAYRVRALRDHVLYAGQVLPGRMLRLELCGEPFLSNEFYLHSAVLEAQRLQARLGYAPGDLVVDVGCGVGRLATGMITVYGAGRYVGVDACARFVAWCRKHIEAGHPSYHFEHVDAFNERYNPQGHVRGRVRLPVADATARIVFLWGVLTNAAAPELEGLIAETSRVLGRGGRAYATVFAEDGVPEVAVNPADYYSPFGYSGPLHVARYGREYLFGLLERFDLAVDEFRYHGGPFAYQSELYLRKV